MNTWYTHKTRPFGRYFYPTSWYCGIVVDIPWAAYFQCCFRKAKLHPARKRRRICTCGWWKKKPSLGTRSVLQRDVGVVHYAISGPQGNNKHIRRTKGCPMCVSIPLLYWPMMLVFYQLYPSMASHCSQLCPFWCAFLHFFLRFLRFLP